MSGCYRAILAEPGLERWRASGQPTKDMEHILDHGRRLVKAKIEDLSTAAPHGRHWIEFAPYSEHTVVPLILDALIQGGGRSEAVSPQLRGIRYASPPERSRVARVLAALDGALEVLLWLDEEGPLGTEALMDEVVPAHRILEVVSELRRCELVEVSGNSVSLSSDVKKVASELKARLEERTTGDRRD